jgi:calcineurin-like phosphoesterase family protein
MNLPDWIISDTHFFHDNIVKYSGRPENHTELMVQNWNNVVKPDDTVLHLGDVLMGARSKWMTIPRLRGRVEVLNSGNHDEEHKRKYIEASWGWRFRPDFTWQYRGWMIFFSHYPAMTELIQDIKGINVHGHIHEKEDPSRQHINVSVERINYRPVWLTDLLDKRIKALEG